MTYIYRVYDLMYLGPMGFCDVCTVAGALRPMVYAGYVTCGLCILIFIIIINVIQGINFGANTNNCRVCKP